MDEDGQHSLSLISTLPMPAWISDPSGLIIKTNPSWKDFSLSDEESLRIAQKLKAGIAFNTEVQLIDSHGSARWFMGSISPMMNSRGEISNWSAIFTDIDQYKSVQTSLEAEIVESQGFLDSILENIPHMVFVKDADHLRFVHFNRAGEELLGYDRRELLGKNDFDFFPPEQANHFVEKDRKVLTSGKLDILEENIATKFGPRILRTKKIPLMSASGKPEYLLGISEDITDWLEAQKTKQELYTERVRTTEREESLKRARFLAEINSVLVSSLNREKTLQDLANKIVTQLGEWCTILTINEENELERVAWAHRDPTKNYLLEQLSSYDPRLYDESSIIFKVAQTGISVFTPVMTRSKLRELSLDENHFTILATLGYQSGLIVPMNFGGKTFGAISIVKVHSHHDQEEKLLAEEIGRKAGVALENASLYQTAQKAISVRNEFLSIASHELKTPITALKLQVQMTMKSVDPEKNIQPPPEKMLKVLETVNDQINRLTTLIEDLLDVSRIEAGKISYHLIPLNLSETLRELCDVYGEHLKQADCFLTTQIKPDVWILADRGRIEQAVLNLLSNAAKYGRGGPVELELSATADAANIFVRDQGMGIAPDKIESIFDRFVRAISSKNISGLGLGLYISREIINGHQGEISVKSRLGHGTEFTIHLPLLKTK